MHVSIRIKGHLDPGWQEWLEGLQIVHEPDGTSQLSGPLKDQPALHGVLTKINHMSLTQLSLESSDPTQPTLEKENYNEQIISCRVFNPGWGHGSP